jgi:hypothetical protein
MPRFNGKQDLNKTQIVERHRRRDQATRGRPTPPGTQPWVRQESEPWFVPMIPQFDLAGIMERIRRIMPMFILRNRMRAPRDLKTKVKG